MRENERERSIEKYLTKGILNLGGKCYKFRAIDNKGVPDRVCVVPWIGMFFVEVKTRKGRVSPIQEHVINEIKDAGGLTFIVHGIAGADKLIEYLSQLKHRVDDLDSQGDLPAPEP